MACHQFVAKPLPELTLTYVSIGPLGTNFSEMRIKMQNFSFMKMHLKTSYAKGGMNEGHNELTHWGREKMTAIFQMPFSKGIFLNENVWVSIKISLMFVPKGSINNIPTLVQIVAWCWSVDKPLSEPMMVSLPMLICVTQPQFVMVLTHSSCWVLRDDNLKCICLKGTAFWLDSLKITHCAKSTISRMQVYQLVIVAKTSFAKDCYCINTLRLIQGWNFADNIFRCIFFYENFCILIKKSSLKYVCKCPIDNNPALVQIWWPGSVGHISQPQRVNRFET